MEGWGGVTIPKKKADSMRIDVSQPQPPKLFALQFNASSSLHSWVYHCLPK